MGNKPLKRGVSQLRGGQPCLLLHGPDLIHDFFFDIDFKASRRSFELVVVTHASFYRPALRKFNFNQS